MEGFFPRLECPNRGKVKKEKVIKAPLYMHYLGWVPLKGRGSICYTRNIERVHFVQYKNSNPHRRAFLPISLQKKPLLRMIYLCKNDC